MNNTPHEATEQMALIEYCDLKGHPYNTIYSITNSAMVPAHYGLKLKKLGVRAGMPDLCLPVMRDRYGGLYLEMKRTKGGKLSDAQGRKIKKLIEAGYKVLVAHGFDEGRDLIEAYLAGET